MTKEEKARAYDEALNWMRTIYQHLSGADKEDAEHFFPDLRESEDERIRKALETFINQPEIADKITFEARIGWLAWLEKQKDANKAIEAVERIDKYIDEHVANAHDMKDSNPDKKYYQGWDDALGKMAGILQDVYSGEKKKASLRDFIDDFPYSDEQKEQKPAEWSEEDKEMLGKVFECISFAEDHYQLEQEEADGTSVKQWLLDHIIPQPKQEWSEEDRRTIDRACVALRAYANGELPDILPSEILGYADKLQSLRPHWKPSEEQMEALADTLEYIPEFFKPKCTLESLERDLKKL